MADKSLSLDNLQVAVFDWDNTLALSRAALVRSVNLILPEYGLPEWDIVKQKRDSQLSFRDNFPLIFGDKAEEAYEKYRKVYMRVAPEVVKAPQRAKDVLLFLKERGIKNVIVSNKDRLLLEYELPLLYQKDLFTKIVCGHEAKRDKPHPEQLWFGVQGLVDEVNSENVWMIGDSFMDSACAIKAGARAIRIGQPIWNDVDTSDEMKNVTFFDDFSCLYAEIKGDK